MPGASDSATLIQQRLAAAVARASAYRARPRAGLPIIPAGMTSMRTWINDGLSRPPRA